MLYEIMMKTKKFVCFILGGILVLFLQGCPFFPDEDYFEEVVPILLICHFCDSCEVYHDNAWHAGWKQEWLQKPYPMGGGYYMWAVKGRIFYPEKIRYLSTSRDDWNAGNQDIDDSLVVCWNPYDKYIQRPFIQKKYVENHYTIEENINVGGQNQYVTWADTAWFRKNVLEKPIDANHFVSF